MESPSVFEANNLSQKILYLIAPAPGCSLAAALFGPGLWPVPPWPRPQPAFDPLPPLCEHRPVLCPSLYGSRRESCRAFPCRSPRAHRPLYRKPLDSGAQFNRKILVRVLA